MAADEIMRGFLKEAEAGAGRVQPFYLHKLSSELEELDQAFPEVWKLLQYTFEQAARLPPAKATLSRQALSEEDQNITTVRSGHDDIDESSVLTHAVQRAILDGYPKPQDYQYSYTVLTKYLATMIVRGATESDVKEYLVTARYGLDSSGETSARIENLAEWIFRHVVNRESALRRGWAEETDDAIYFGKKPSHELNSAKTSGGLRNDLLRFRGSENGPCCVDMFSSRSIELQDHCVATPFRFLDLPVELRSWICHLLLAPGTVTLRSCAHHLPYGTSPVLTPGILATCKQVNQEAAGLIFKNTFIANVPLEPTGIPRPALHRSQLPFHALSRIRSLILIIDSAQYLSQPQPLNCDWAPLQALTSLTALRVTAIEGNEAMLVGEWVPVLTEIVIRVPAGCKIEYGCGSEEENRSVRDMVWRVARTNVLRLQNIVMEAMEMDVDVLKEAAERIPENVARGSKSGKTIPSRLPLSNWEGRCVELH